MNSSATFVRWTSRIVLPIFVFVQTFLCGPAVFAQTSLPPLTVTGSLVASSSAATAAATASTLTSVLAAIAGPALTTVTAVAGGSVTSVLAGAAVAGGTNEPALINMRFEGIDIRTVLLYLADITGDTILPDKTLRGEVTIINPKPVTPEEAKQIIFSILEMDGWTIVRHEHLVKIVRSGTAKQRPIKTLQPPEDVSKMDAEDIIRAQVIYPKHILAKDVEKFIRPLLTAGAGEIILNEPTGAVIIIDTGANIKRLMEVIELIDRVIEGGTIDIRILPLTYADEKEMVTLLQGIFESAVIKDPTAQKLSIGNFPGEEKPRPPVELTLTKVAGTKANFIAEPRTHSLIVISAKGNFDMIMRLIEALDLPTTEKEDYVHIYPLQHTKAAEIADTLNTIFSSGERTSGSPSGTPAPSTRRSTEEDSSRSSSGSSSDRNSLFRSQPPAARPSSQPARVVRAASGGAGSGIGNLAGKVSVLYDEPSNSLIIITARRYYTSVKALIERLDQRTPQVWIEALIVEVSRDKNFNLGVGWKRIVDTDQIFGGNSQGRSLIQALDTTLGPAFDEAKGQITPASIPGIAYSYGKYDSQGHFDPYMTLQTAEGVNDINVLSTPSILASNNKEANITVGKQIPISRYSQGTDSTISDYSWEYTDVNIELDVTPRINRHREVALEAKVSVKEDGGQPEGATANAPPIILDRTASTEVVLQDRQTLVIGGLIKDDFNISFNKVPLLGDIPIIKHAFRTETSKKVKTELLIFITPFVVQTEAEGDVLTQDVRDRYRGADAFVTSPDRVSLYDDLNKEQSQATIYDDWREFEKKVEFAEKYFRPEKGTYGAPAHSKPRTYFMPINARPKEERLDEGEINLNFNEAKPSGDSGTLEQLKPSPDSKSDSGSIDTLPREGATTVPAILERERALLGQPAPDNR